MTGIGIRFLIKIGKKEHIDDLLKNGTIFMNTMDFFIDYEENELKGDKDEGLAGIEQVLRLELFHNNMPLGYTNSAQLKYRDDE